MEGKERHLFQYDCGCWGYKQLRTLRRRPAAALACPEHARQRRPSQLVLRVRSALQSAVPDLGPVVLEACLLPSGAKPFDMWLPRWGIAVEVDGKQHFRGGMHSTPALAQFARDRAVDEACMQHRLRLLRCHYLDDKQWGTRAAQAVAAVRHSPHCSFVFCTGSYKYEAGSHAAPTL